jgi:hypothetical protein
MVTRRNAVVVDRGLTGLGLIAGRTYRHQQTIITLHGRIVNYRVPWQRGGRFASNCIRFGPETYLDPGDAPGRYLNHACEPNAGIRKAGNRLVVVAATTIPVGTEILIDYSTTIGDDDIWMMRCRCGSSACRRTIRRFGSLPQALQIRYLRDGLVPGYIVRTLIRNPRLNGAEAR